MDCNCASYWIIVVNILYDKEYLYFFFRLLAEPRAKALKMLHKYQEKVGIYIVDI